ncbi:uncharacterized protein LOC128221141 [Mya arenaria]|uniref:uncharacterized protein LOC128221141 n=1 Tax=Mya arenaria TaxID=6604 RepID=UPI0022E5DCA6|nr:uncharacterized protein LOC128221141 [Mya arenaria]
MRNTAFIFVTLLILVGLQVQVSQACSGISCPYYFGTTPLRCVNKPGKRKKRSSSPTRSTIAITHRYLYYRGYYMEFGGTRSGGYAKVGTYRWGSRCSADTESRPAGWSRVSLDCMRKCADSYKWMYGSFHWYNNNCHDFANRMARVLYDGRYSSSYCPWWCTYRK